MWHWCHVKNPVLLIFMFSLQSHGYSSLSAEKPQTPRLMKPNAVSSSAKTVLFFFAPKKSWHFGNTSLLSDSNELNTQCLQTFQFVLVVQSQIWDPEKMLLLRGRPSWYEFVAWIQQVIETDGVARPALVWLESNGASKRNVLVQALFHLATCLWI